MNGGWVVCPHRRFQVIIQETRVTPNNDRHTYTVSPGHRFSVVC